MVLGMLPEARGDELAKQPLAVEHLLDLWPTPRSVACGSRSASTTSSSWNCTPSKPSFLYSRILAANATSLRTGGPKGSAPGADVPGAEGEAVALFARIEEPFKFSPRYADSTAYTFLVNAPECCEEWSVCSSGAFSRVLCESFDNFLPGLRSTLAGIEHVFALRAADGRILSLSALRSLYAVLPGAGCAPATRTGPVRPPRDRHGSTASSLSCARRSCEPIDSPLPVRLLERL